MLEIYDLRSGAHVSYACTTRDIEKPQLHIGHQSAVKRNQKNTAEIRGETPKMQRLWKTQAVFSNQCKYVVVAWWDIPSLPQRYPRPSGRPSASGITENTLCCSVKPRMVTPPRPNRDKRRKLANIVTWFLRIKGATVHVRCSSCSRREIITWNCSGTSVGIDTCYAREVGGCDTAG